jgi:hypothetical protein
MQMNLSRNVAEMNRNIKPGLKRTFSDDEIQWLPAPVRKYIEFSGFRDKGHVQSARLKQKGMFRTGINTGWMPFKAEEYFNLATPSYIWNARMKGPMGFTFNNLEQYIDGEGRVNVRLINLFTIADSVGNEITQGELIRFLGELMWTPSAFVEKYIHWKPIDDRSAQATIDYRDIKASGTFHFDGQGKIINFTAKRYRSAGKYYFFDDWSTPVYKYSNFSGIRLPSDIEYVWNLNTGELIYTRTELLSAEYDVPGIY